MIDLATFLQLVEGVRNAGFARDIEWAENCAPPIDADAFAFEAIYVICNSGMKNTIARAIYDRVMEALNADRSASKVFGHLGKAAAIDQIWQSRAQLFARYLVAVEERAVVAFCETLPWIGPITKYHLAKNFGCQVAKPDVHLQRLADRERCSAQDLCRRLARDSGYKLATVDVILWRACAIGLIDSRTGRLAPSVRRTA